jgi:hypothetical protein
MSRNYFRAFGVLTLLLNPAMFSDMLDPATPRTQFLRSLVLMLAIEILGFGLAFLRKWAALYFSVPLFYFGIRATIISIYGVAFPLNLLAMLCSLSLTLPLVVTIRNWKNLTWGSRLF